MAPVTVTIIDEEMPRARLGLLLQHFSEIEDDREPWRIMYPLKEVLLLVTCATIASCDDFDDIVAWGEHHLDFLRRFSRSITASRASAGCAAWSTASIRHCSDAASRPGWRRCGRNAMSSSPSTARPHAAPMIIARASRPCTRSVLMRRPQD